MEKRDKWVEFFNEATDEGFDVTNAMKYADDMLAEWEGEQIDAAEYAGEDR